jgi:MFS transporter, DHA1 family, multidrug resistance protein
VLSLARGWKIFILASVPLKRDFNQSFQSIVQETDWRHNEYSAASQPSTIMDNVDRYVEKSELDASPSRFQEIRDGHPIERAESRASTDSDSTTSPIDREETHMSRIATARDNPGILERNATAMSRIETQRTQHSVTVGASVKSRKTREEMPLMGAGKPYPKNLPEREEYVVEFDGAEDPMHAQNWPLRRK